MPLRPETLAALARAVRAGLQPLRTAGQPQATYAAVRHAVVVGLHPLRGQPAEGGAS